LAAAIAALGVGYGIVNVSEPASVDTELGVDQASVGAETERMIAINETWSDLVASQKLADFAPPLVVTESLAARAAALAETERLMAVNQNWSEAVGAQKLADFAPPLVVTESLAARAAALAETERMMTINETWPEAGSVSSFGGNGAAQALVDFLRIQHATRAQNAQHESRIEFLTEQWKARNDPRLYGGPSRPIVVE
jgi:hypothetical protein